MRPMPETVSSTLACADCGRGDDGTRGWRVYITAARPPATKTFCPDCAERELGEDER